MSASPTHTYPGCGFAWPCWADCKTLPDQYTGSASWTQVGEGSMKFIPNPRSGEGSLLLETNFRAGSCGRASQFVATVGFPHPPFTDVSRRACLKRAGSG